MTESICYEASNLWSVVFYICWVEMFLSLVSPPRRHITWNSPGGASQRAGLELMDMMAVYQEGAYERLCRLASDAEVNLVKLLMPFTGIHCMAC